jgi:hypothetical protein
MTGKNINETLRFYFVISRACYIVRDVVCFWRMMQMNKFYVRAMALLVITATAGALGGCSSSGSSGILGGVFGNDTASKTAENEATVALMPVIGMPAKISKHLTDSMNKSMKAENIKIASGDLASHNMRGYMAASGIKEGSKLSYVWDVLDREGKRVHRIKGEEVVKGKFEDNAPWAAIGENVVNKVANDTAKQLAGWMKDAKVAALAQPTAAKIASLKKPVAAAAPEAPKYTAGIAKEARSGQVVTKVIPVTGAPGDGKTSLSNALRKQLGLRGIKTGGGSGTDFYSIKGSVNMGKVSSTDGKQDISIDWRVFDPAGKSLGKISQRNRIVKGALDGKWGAVAEAAAGAAATGIVKLLPKK